MIQRICGCGQPFESKYRRSRCKECLKKHKIQSRSRYSDLEIIERLKKAAETVDGRLNTVQFCLHTASPSVRFINKRFGSWEQALKVAGLWEKRERLKEGWKYCNYCNNPFLSSTDDHKYCKDTCRTYAYRERRILKKPQEKICKTCGRPWTDPKTLKKRKPKYCGQCQEYFISRYRKAKKIDQSKTISYKV